MATPSLSLAFDALEFIEQLKASGVPEEQAKGHVKVLTAIVRQMDSRVDDLAAKREKETAERFDSLADRNEQQVKGRLDGLATRQELDARLAATEANLKRDMKELELRMVIKMGAMILGGIGLLIGLMRAWPLPVQYVPPGQEMRMPALGQGVPAPSR
ncbi:MAG: hypothetical protein HQL96_00900 [Magnetococcales bacterium]|nr:hypothetical protein [Magnetococcales bacterium]